jgi:hypothetical protein
MGSFQKVLLVFYIEWGGTLGSWFIFLWLNIDCSSPRVVSSWFLRDTLRGFLDGYKFHLFLRSFLVGSWRELLHP